MQTKKRKHQNVDLSKQKVQYLVDVPLNPTEGLQFSKKGPQLVRIDYNDVPKYMNPSSPFLLGGKMFGWSMSNKFATNFKLQQKQKKNAVNSDKLKTKKNNKIEYEQQQQQYNIGLEGQDDYNKQQYMN